MRPELEVPFWIAAGVVAYSYAGYPCLLALLAGFRPAREINRGSQTPGVSIVIVAHDEERTIEAKLRNCLELDYPPEQLEIFVASDGSRDATEAIVTRFADRGVRLLSLPGPRGKPAALNQAVPHTTGEILVLCDARQRLAVDAVRELAAHFADPTVGAVSGELHLEAEAGTAGEGVGAYWRYEKLIRRLESRVGSTVGVTGALYAVRRELFRPLDPRTILDDVAIPMEVARAGYRVLFEPRARAYDRVSPDPAAEYRRKVRTLAGNYQLVALRPFLIDPARNPLFWQFVSHKLSRLAVPWCLVLLLVTSGLLWERASPFYAAAFAAQVVFYALAAGGWCLERMGLRPRILSIPYAFTLLNVAAATSLLGFLRGRQTAAWKAAVS